MTTEHERVVMRHHNLTATQKRCLMKLQAVKENDGWVWNYLDTIGFNSRVLNTLVVKGLVEHDRGHYRAITPIA